MHKAIAALLFAVSPTLFAAELQIPLEFEFVAINGNNVNNNFFSHNGSEPLQVGTNKVALVYNDLIRDNIGDSHSKIKSAPFVVTFQAQADQNYQLQAAIEIDNVKTARQFAQDPQVLIQTSNGSNIPVEVALTDAQPQGIFNQLSNNNSAIVATGGTVTPTVTAASATALTTAATQTPQTPEMDNNKPMKMLQYWWQESGADVHNAFTGWAVQHLNTTQTVAPQHDDQAQSMLQYWFIKADESTRKQFLSWAFQNM
ncbi:MAG: DUF2057 family protein [Ferrimonas sp.]